MGSQLAGGTHVLVDPWLSAPTIPDALRDPARVDLVLLTHGHGDHIADAEAAHAKHGCPVVAKYELAVHFGGKGVNVVGFNTGGTIERLGIRFTMTHAIHSGGIQRGRGDGRLRRRAGRLRITFPEGAKSTGRRHRRLLGHGPDRPDLPAGRRDPADRRLVHDGAARGRPRGAPLGVQHVPAATGALPALDRARPRRSHDEIGKLGLGGVTVHPLRPGDAASF